MRTQKLDSWGRKINYKHSYNLDVFKTKNDLFFYLLGAFITDGNVFIYRNGKSTKTSLSSNDIDWLKLINKELSHTNLVSVKNKGGVLNIYDIEIANILLDNNCKPKKSLTQTMPEVPQNYLRDFLRGCMDGDGSISLINHKVI